MGRRVRVDRDDIMWAMNSSLDEVEWFLDLRTGEVIPYEEAPGDEPDGGVDPTSDASRYQPIEPLPSREAWRIRADFVATVEDPELRRALEDALDGRGAFRRFKDVIDRQEDERQRWFRFEEERLLEEARSQLEQDGIEAEFVRPG